MTDTWVQLNMLVFFPVVLSLFPLLLVVVPVKLSHTETYVTENSDHNWWENSTGATSGGVAVKLPLKT